MPVVRPIGHEERLSIVDHLDELRNRLIAVVVVFMAAFAVCYWQNAAVLDIVNRPLVQSQHPGKGNDALEQAARYDTAVGKALDALSPALRATQSALGGLAGQPGVSDEARAKADAAARQLAGA
ncbi:MAG: twin-arginine translocase subunit TatC, partial [Solirubrobacteraceae bacterium]|nr:twin-arginine translocase subunit TatC [Solirubrobacteraceae bacterium]